jgi:t-SNARE complex subunit (syntaxin)
VAAQAEVVDHVHATTGQVLDDVDAGHAQLVKAAATRRTARHVYVTVTLALAALLLFLDYVFD